MDLLINFSILILVIIEYFSFFYTILRRNRKTFSRNLLVFGGALLVCLIGISFGEWRLTQLYFIGQMFSLGLIFWIFEISIIDILKLNMIAFPTLSILETIIIHVVQVVADGGEKKNQISCMIYIIVSLWFYYVLLGRKLDKEAFQMMDHVWPILSGVMFLICGLITYFTFVLEEVIETKEKMVGLILIIVGGLAIFILNYVMIYYFNTKQKYQMQSAFLEEYNKQQKRYFEDLLAKEQDTRQFRHDITAHLLQIQTLCEKEEYEEEKQYIRELLDELSFINKKGYCVGNDIIDTILNNYLSPITLVCSVEVKGYVSDDIGIAKKDLCVIVSNLVKNAVEAIEQCTCEHKEIIFEANQGKQFLSIKVKNTADSEKIHIQNKYPVTRKKDKRMHGLGIRNVKAVVESYSGSYQYQIENGYYIAEAQLMI